MGAKFFDSTVLGNAEKALDFIGNVLCGSHCPRLVLMDIRLPDGNGIELTARIKAMLPETAVVVVSHYSAQIYVERAHAAGAFAYITKDKVHQELLPTIAGALAGRSTVTPPERKP